jgi:hypothetical protein
VTLFYEEIYLYTQVLVYISNNCNIYVHKIFKKNGKWVSQIVCQWWYIVHHSGNNIVISHVLHKTMISPQPLPRRQPWWCRWNSRQFCWDFSCLGGGFSTHVSWSLEYMLIVSVMLPCIFCNIWNNLNMHSDSNIAKWLL